MAGAAHLLDLDPDRVLVAIDAHLDDALGVARGLALPPQHAARAAEIPSLPGGDGLRQRLGVHVRDHRHVARAGVGRDAGDEPVGVEFGRQRRAFLKLYCGARRREGCVFRHIQPVIRGSRAAASPESITTERAELVWSIAWTICDYGLRPSLRSAEMKLLPPAPPPLFLFVGKREGR